MTAKKVTVCHSEYDRLTRVIMAEPTYMEITEVINETQKHFLSDNIDTEVATHQHQMFVNVLKNEGIQVEHLPVKDHLNEQVFTRDIGFTLGETLFIANMASEIRKEETAILTHALEKDETSCQQLDGPSIEGGDVLIDGKTIYVGVSERTTQAAIDVLKQQLPDFDIYLLPLVGDILHLDCTFNIVSEKDALIYRDGLTAEAVEMLEKRYNLIDVSVEEQFTLGTNVLAIGHKKVISLPDNKAVNKQLTDKGYHVIEVAFDEIIKSGGSFRCCTLPVVRMND